MLATSASRPAMLSETMRRVRLEKLRAKKNCPARRSHPSGCHPASTGFSVARVSMTTVAVSSALRLASGCVRSSNGQNRRLFQKGCPRCLSRSHTTSSQRPRHTVGKPRMTPASGFLEAVSDPVQRFDHFEFVVHDLELLAQPLDVAVDGAIVDVNLVVIGRIHQGVAALDDAGPRGERLKDQKFR